MHAILDAEMAGSSGEGLSRSREHTRGLQLQATVTAAATLVLIAMGGVVRATDSGLACPDWPACYGQWIPPADLNMWLEHSHRLWAGIVGLSIAWLAGWTALRYRHRPALWRLSLAALMLVLVQAALGAAVVLLQLRAALVTLHLGLSLLVVACLIVIAVMARPAGARLTNGRASARRMGRWALAVSLVVFAQALLGSQATGQGAAYVFNAVPIWLADDSWTGDAREWLHVAHRVGGYLVAAVVIVFALAVRRLRRDDLAAPGWVGWLPWLAVGLVAVQVALGLTNVLTRAAVASAIAHLVVASWLWVVVVTITALGLADARAVSAPRGPAARDLVAPPRHEPRGTDERTTPKMITEEVTQ